MTYRVVLPSWSHTRNPGRQSGAKSARHHHRRALRARVEVGEPEARPKGPVPEHPVPYMFESKLATRKTHCCGNIWFDQKLTGVLGMYVRANSSFVGHTGGNPGLGGRSGNGDRSPVAKNLWCACKKNRCPVRSCRKWDLSFLEI